MKPWLLGKTIINYIGFDIKIGNVLSIVYIYIYISNNICLFIYYFFVFIQRSLENEVNNLLYYFPTIFGVNIRANYTIIVTVLSRIITINTTFNLYSDRNQPFVQQRKQQHYWNLFFIKSSVLIKHLSFSISKRIRRRLIILHFISLKSLIRP